MNNTNRFIDDEDYIDQVQLDNMLASGAIRILAVNGKPLPEPQLILKGSVVRLQVNGVTLTGAKEITITPSPKPDRPR